MMAILQAIVFSIAVVSLIVLVAVGSWACAALVFWGQEDDE